MVSPGEHVYGLYFNGLVSVLFQVGQVAGQGGRVARDVDDACWFAPGNGLEDRFATAGPGRVEDDDAGADAFPDEFRQFIDGIAEDKLCIPYVIVPGIADGVADGRGDDFDAVDLFCFLGQEQCNGPGATVDVGNGFLSGQQKPVPVRKAAGPVRCLPGRRTGPKYGRSAARWNRESYLCHI